MFVYTFLEVVRQKQTVRAEGELHEMTRGSQKKLNLKGLIPYSLAEVARVYNKIISPIVEAAEKAWQWSLWRRNHQFKAKFYLYRKRGHFV
jgi:hypothetical protein